MNTFILNNFKVQSTGADGGRNYIMAKVMHNCIEREMLVCFGNKEDEHILKNFDSVSVRGKLTDQGLQQTLILSEAEIIK